MKENYVLGPIAYKENPLIHSLECIQIYHQLN